MALVNCPDCGREMSDSASVCLQCGRPMQGRAPEKRRTNPWMIIGWLVLLVILLPLATCSLFLGGISTDAFNDYNERAAAKREPPPASLEVLVQGYEAAARAGNRDAMRDYANKISTHYPGTMLPPVEAAPTKDEFTAD